MNSVGGPVRGIRVRAGVGLAAVALLAGMSAGCTSGGPHGGSASSAASPAARSAARPSGSVFASGPLVTVPEWPSPRGTPPTTLAGFYAQRLTWVPCDFFFLCARLYVPFDYGHPGGPAFSLPVIKLPAAQPTHRIGPLVFNPGGPGASGLQYMLYVRTGGGLTQAVRNRFDIVSFDPRGVGASVPALRCMTGRQLDAYLAVNDEPATPAQLAAVVSAGKGYAQACERNAKALLPYVGTPDSARDMDLLRAALGQPQLTYLGWSYGTVLGASYIQQFPHRVRAAVLDGAVAPALSGLDADIAQARGFSVAFGQFVSWCAGQQGCPLARTVPAATRQVAGLITRANAHPLASKVPGPQSADGSMLLQGIAAALYTKAAWLNLKAGLAQALNDGYGTNLVALANWLLQRRPDGSYSNLTDVLTAVGCIDHPWPTSVGAYQAAAAAAAKASPLFGTWSVYGSLPCAYWPVAPRPVLSGSTPSGAPPALVVGNLHDPATPYAWAVALTRWLQQGGSQQGVLLGWNGEGHTSYGMGSSCINNTVDAYLISLHTPRSGTVCP